MKNKIIDCITFFDNTLMFDLRFNILKEVVDTFVICESKYDHRNRKKKLNFDTKFLSEKKIKYFVLEEQFPKSSSIWQNQAIQREYMLKKLDFAEDEDLIFSDPDEIPNPDILNDFQLKNKYGIFFKVVSIINSIYLIPMRHLGKAQEYVKKEILNLLIL